jgi:hypothetical protein
VHIISNDENKLVFVELELELVELKLRNPRVWSLSFELIAKYFAEKNINLNLKI